MFQIRTVWLSHTGCWGLIWPLKFLTSTKYTFLKLLGHEDSSGVCSFVQSHPYFFTIVRAFSFQLKLAYFPWISRIFKNMLLGRDGFGKKHVCHVILYTLRISKKYVIHWEKFFMYKPKIGIDVGRFLDQLVVQIQILVYWNQISNLTFPQYELEELVLQSQFLDLKCNNFA